MSENRTERPTKQKLRRARERGEVAKSPFLAGAIVFTGGVLLIPLLASGFQKSMRAAFTHPQLEGAFYAVIPPLILPLLAVLGGLVVLAFGAHFFQTGWMWKFRKKRGKGERGFVISLLQLAVIGGIGYLSLKTIKIDPALLFSTPSNQSNFIFKNIFYLAIEIGIVLIFIGVGDFIYQKWRFYKKMHMTPEEKRQELRESEGDPQMKSRMRKRIE